MRCSVFIMFILFCACSYSQTRLSTSDTLNVWYNKYSDIGGVRSNVKPGLYTIIDSSGRIINKTYKHNSDYHDTTIIWIDSNFHSYNVSLNIDSLHSQKFSQRWTNGELSSQGLYFKNEISSEYETFTMNFDKNTREFSSEYNLNFLNTGGIIKISVDYYSNGKVKNITEDNESLNSIVIMNYYDNGYLKSLKKYNKFNIDEKKHNCVFEPYNNSNSGTWKYYDKNWNEIVYIYGGSLGVEYVPNGKWSYYNKNGNLIKEVDYDNGVILE